MRDPKFVEISFISVFDVATHVEKMNLFFSTSCKSKVFRQQFRRIFAQVKKQFRLLHFSIQYYVDLSALFETFFVLNFFQFLAVTIQNVLPFLVGIISVFPGIIIPSLTGAYRNEHNLNETLHLSPVEASWLGEKKDLGILRICDFFRK